MTNRRTFGLSALALALGCPVRAADENFHAAEVLRIELDNRLEPGRTYRPRITVKNTGNLRWERGEFAITFDNTKSPTGRAVKSEKFEFMTKLAQDVLPGEIITVSDEIVAPPQPGLWEMTALVRNRWKRLGPGRTEKVEVLARYDARIESVRLEDVMRPGKDTEITVRLTNNGKSEWSEDLVDLFLTIRRASGSTTQFRDEWEQHVPLKETVPVNGRAEFRIRHRVKRAGTITLQFSMWDRRERDDFGEVEYREVVIA